MLSILALTSRDINRITTALKDTLTLVFAPAIFVAIFGIISAYILFITSSDYFYKRNRAVKIGNFIFASILNILRSLPFIMLVVVMIPVTQFLVGTFLGVKGALPSIFLSAMPFFARIAYNALRDIPSGTIEALKSMGTPTRKIMLILLTESMPPMVAGFTVTLVSSVGFVAVAGLVGAGGLGYLSNVSIGQSKYDVAYICVFLILAIVFVIQIGGDFIAKKLDRRS
jgi:D-methionine transport system permease protein